MALLHVSLVMRKTLDLLLKAIVYLSRVGKSSWHQMQFKEMSFDQPWRDDDSLLSRKRKSVSWTGGLCFLFFVRSFGNKSQGENSLAQTMGTTTMIKSRNNSRILEPSSHRRLRALA